MPWRYQPVWVEYDDERTYTLVEAFFDDAGNLTYWTEGDSCPDGEDIEAVTADLNRMIVDALSWEPVRREDLTVGMTFRVSQQQEGVSWRTLMKNSKATPRRPCAEP